MYESWEGGGSKRVKSGFERDSVVKRRQEGSSCERSGEDGKSIEKDRKAACPQNIPPPPAHLCHHRRRFSLRMRTAGRLEAADSNQLSAQLHPATIQCCLMVEKIVSEKNKVELLILFLYLYCSHIITMAMQFPKAHCKYMVSNISCRYVLYKQGL